MVNESSFQKWKQHITQLLDALSMGKKLAKRFLLESLFIVARSFTKHVKSNEVASSIFRRSWSPRQLERERSLSSRKSSERRPSWRSVPSSSFLSISSIVV